MEEEIWKECSRYPSHDVSSLGRVRNGRTMQIIKPYLDLRGYLSIGRNRIHTLVLESFVGSSTTNQECRHLNSIKTDNRLENLRWGTHAENEADKNRSNNERKRKRIGSNQTETVFLSDFDVLTIKELIKMGKSLVEIASYFGVHPNRISTIKRKKYFKHLDNLE